MPKYIFAIKDTHSHPDGRNRARALLDSGGINIFFIEWAKPIDIENITGSFAGLATTDAEPSLKTLTQLAISKGIEVVSCDLTAEETVMRLDALNDGYAPYDLLSAFQPWGKAIRDKHAARVISDRMKTNPDSNCWGLVMFGSDHFKPEDGRNAEPLNKLIIRESGIDCFIMSNTSTDVSSEAALKKQVPAPSSSSSSSSSSPSSSRDEEKEVASSSFSSSSSSTYKGPKLTSSSWAEVAKLKSNTSKRG